MTRKSLAPKCLSGYFRLVGHTLSQQQQQQQQQQHQHIKNETQYFPKQSAVQQLKQRLFSIKTATYLNLKSSFQFKC